MNAHTHPKPGVDPLSWIPTPFGPLMGVCCAAMITLGLAACGGSGGKKPENEPAPADKVSNLLVKMSDARTQAADAEEAAEEALADAKKKAGLLDAIKVRGESAVAVRNAQAILNARAAAGQAVVDAEKAIADLEAARKEAEALPPDTANLATLQRGITNAITNARENLAAAKAIRDDTGAGSLARYVQVVTGAGTDDMTPDDKGAEVARAIHDKLGTPSRPPGITSGTAVEAARESGIFSSMHDAPSHAQTWQEIFDDRIERKATATSPKNLLAVEGEQTTMEERNYDPNGAPGKFMGVDGTFYCLETTCKVTGGKFGAAWYFEPTETDVGFQPYRYKRSETGYARYKEYVEYGYWMAANGRLTDIRPFTIFHTTPSDDGLGDTSEGLGNTATYRGFALGMSVVTVADERGGRKPVKSGKFTADVTLTATFGSNPTVKGVIGNFRGNAVDEDWEVELRSQGLRGPGAAFADTSAETRVPRVEDNGYWRAAPWGGSNGPPVVRPKGIAGDFDANFEDGRAVGAYATRKQ